MRTRILFGFFVLCLLPTASFSGESFIFGKVWVSITKDSRVNWVWGFAQGQEVILEELEIKDKSNLKYFIPVNDADVISEIMTQYYDDFANCYIPWKYMASVAKMKLQGKSQKVIEKELERLRQYADWARPK